MFPGSGHQTYNNNGGYNEGFQRPNAPPPQQQYRSGGYGNNEGYGNDGGYMRPSAPPPNQGNYNNNDGNYGNRNGNGNGSYSNYNNGNQQGGYQQQQPGGYQQQQSNYEQQQQGYYQRPPSTPQSFNLDQVNQQFTYSQCNGRRKALIIGINYFNSQNELRGCINDAHNIRDFLTQNYGYSSDDIVMLTDDQREMARVPTRDNMLRAMKWLVKDAQPNDSLFFHYSGHGGLTKDLDNDEESGMDSVVYPVDFQTNGQIVDDEIHEIMVRPLQAGVRLTALFDSCHSGSVLDLPYTYSTKGVVKEPNMWKDVGEDGLQAAMAYASGNRSMLLKSLGSIATTVKNSMTNNTNRDKVKQQKFSPADIIMLSGSKDDQTSADATEAGKSTGAMSWAFINVLRAQPQQSYLTLLQNMRKQLSGKYTQKPQLSASHPMDVNLQFIF